MSALSGAFLARCGTFDMVRDGARYALLTPNGAVFGTYDTAAQAMNASVVHMAATYKARTSK